MGIDFNGYLIFKRISTLKDLGKMGSVKGSLNKLTPF